MTQYDSSHSQTPMLQMAIFSYEQISTEALIKASERVIPSMLRKKSGRSESRMRSYYAGRSVLAFLAAVNHKSVFVTPNHEFGFLELYDSLGKKIPNLFVNLSHTQNMAVAVLGAMTAGVDIESKDRSARKVLPRVATDEEIKWVERQPALLSHPPIPTDIFLWSAKEAFSKALGLGMNFGLNAFQIFPSEKPPFKAATQLQGPFAVDQPRILLETHENFLITVCTDEKQALAGIHRRVLSLSDFQMLG